MQTFYIICKRQKHLYFPIHRTSEEVFKVDNFRKLERLYVRTLSECEHEADLLATCAHVGHLSIQKERTTLGARCVVSALRHFGGLTSLELSLAGYKYDRTFDIIARSLPHLEKLSLSRYQITQAQFKFLVSALPKLRLLDVSGSKVAFSQALYNSIADIIDNRFREAPLSIRANQKSTARLLTYDKSLVHVVPDRV